MLGGMYPTRAAFAVLVGVPGLPRYEYEYLELPCSLQSGKGFLTDKHLQTSFRLDMLTPDSGPGPVSKQGLGECCALSTHESSARSPKENFSPVGVTVRVPTEPSLLWMTNTAFSTSRFHPTSTWLTRS